MCQVLQTNFDDFVFNLKIIQTELIVIPKSSAICILKNRAHCSFNEWMKEWMWRFNWIVFASHVYVFLKGNVCKEEWNEFKKIERTWIIQIEYCSSRIYWLTFLFALNNCMWCRGKKIHQCLISSHFLPVLRDSRRVDRRHYAMDAFFQHNWHTQTRVAMHKWSTYKRHPKCSLLSDWTQLATYFGIRSKLWKNSALLLRLINKYPHGKT
jgi:hypothetical protein